ncbi:DUF1697 domain-containing protein [Azoarcus sp. L1K30]|uniref:DUF1697 domain-containing protein n=1 Tax=Azoarcus sp. L1K30 TaxID=2820277 RepID=UPI001B83B017|nr:DUF1697 domain-containing protein [Azoarcus sp. L1K30]MBR0565599.1 DUF1697 domain-containing protein [Azoarcus sp. L1K30]
MNNYAIFLRGVMPTGKNKVPMGALRVALSDAGLVDVQTYIQSGNVIAKSALDRHAVQLLVHETIAREIGADIVVIARTHADVGRVMEANPFPSNAASRTYFSLLAQPPSAHLVDALRQLDFSPDCVHVTSDAIYTLYATKLSDSKFNNNFFERKLKVAATTRNFNTLSRCAALSA